MLIGLWCTASAQAQFTPTEVPEYRIHNVTNRESVAWGINSIGAISGTYRLVNCNGEAVKDPNGKDVWHAFVWEPSGPTGLPGVFTDLNDLAGLPSDSIAAAYDVNDAGQVVGVYWERDGSSYDAHAFAWNRPAASYGVIQAVAGANRPSYAFAISNHDTAVIVGTYDPEGGAPGAPVSVSQPWRISYVENQGFRYVMPVSSVNGGALTDLDPEQLVHSDWMTGGYDVTTVGDASSTPATGEATNPFNCLGIGSCGDEIVDCAIGHLWPPDNSGGLLEGETLGATTKEGRTVGLGLNTVVNYVGWGKALDESDACTQFATYWENSMALDPTLLPQLTGQLTSEEMLAHQVSEEYMLVDDEQQVHVVGADRFNNVAAIWMASEGNDRSNDASWVGYALQDLVCDWDGTHPTWKDLFEAFDINERGWIVGFGENNYTQEGCPELMPETNQAFILIPINGCAGDLNGDGVVDITDLLQLLAGWGGPSLYSQDCDSDIDVDDLLTLLGNWGDCSEPGGADVPETVEDCLNMFPIGSLELEKCLDAVQQQQN